LLEDGSEKALTPPEAKLAKGLAVMEPIPMMGDFDRARAAKGDEDPAKAPNPLEGFAGVAAGVVSAVGGIETFGDGLRRKGDVAGAEVAGGVNVAPGDDVLPNTGGPLTFEKGDLTPLYAEKPLDTGLDGFADWMEEERYVNLESGKW
jgi:hypothetical protein